jgi:hypothetical protein
LFGRSRRTDEDLEGVHQFGLEALGELPLARRGKAKCSELGVSNDPERLHSLSNYPSPVSGDQLQSFLAAINWMRDHLINYSATTKPLYELLEVLMKPLLW